jgi:hypothetical protein
MIFGGKDMTMLDVFLVTLLAAFVAGWLCAGFRNIGMLFGENTLTLNNSGPLSLSVAIGVAGFAFSAGPFFSGWYPAFQASSKKTTQTDSSNQVVQTSE